MRQRSSTLGLVVAILLLGSVPIVRSAESDPRAVATFECLGLYWKTPGGADEGPCRVEYRRAGEEKWREAMPLVFDRRNGEYRGSIVALQPGKRYEVSLRLVKTGARAAIEAQTWSNSPPLAKTIGLPARSSDMLTVSESGSPAGYVLYTPAGDSATIDVEGRADHCITVRASYVVIRRLVLKNAKVHAILLAEGVHDVFIEECDISGWGRVMDDGWGKDYDAAVYARQSDIARIVVQRNRIHHPRSNSNNWRQPRPREGKREPNHPEGPQAVCFWNSEGNHVIRYNTVFSDEEHQYNDVFGAGSNFSERGFPNRDSDIYGNLLSHCCDDAIESEGANCNVRIWGNYLTDAYVGIACASTSIGPLYVWRNVNAVSRVAPGGSAGGFLKTSDRTGGGRVYVFHNTILQPPSPSDPGKTLGAGTGLGWGGPMSNVTSRNNILYVTRQAIADRAGDPLGDYDYDLYSARVVAADGQESHGIRGVPVFTPGWGRKDGQGVFTLSPESPGFDAGIRLPNFNDAYTGGGPDLGAHEAGTGPMQFGADAVKDGRETPGGPPSR